MSAFARQVPEPLAGSRVLFMAAEASLVVDDRVLVRRELLRIEPSMQRLEVRAPGVRGAVTVDLSIDLVHATLIGGDRTTLEIDFMVPGPRAAAIDAWAMCARNRSEAEILDAFGRALVPDLTARDPSMAPMIFSPGRFLLRAATREGPLTLRLGSSIANVVPRAAVG